MTGRVGRNGSLWESGQPVDEGQVYGGRGGQGLADALDGGGQQRRGDRHGDGAYGSRAAGTSAGVRPPASGTVRGRWYPIPARATLS